MNDKERIMYSSKFTKDHDWWLINTLCEEFAQQERVPVKSRTLKVRAAKFLGTNIERDLSRSELRLLFAKARKMKVHNKKDERSRNEVFARKIQQTYNS